MCNGRRCFGHDGYGARPRGASRVFGFADFRPGQEEILSAILAGEEVMAIMPTGSGKSLLFQLPALLETG